MKIFLTSLFIVFCLCAIGFAKTYNVKAHNSTMNLKKSDVIKIELSENASTGFEWKLESSDENVAKIIDKKVVYPKPPIGKPPMCGQSGTAIYKIKAINSGSATISGVYARSWEKNPPMSEYKLNIIVK